MELRRFDPDRYYRPTDRRDWRFSVLSARWLSGGTRWSRSGVSCALAIASCIGAMHSMQVPGRSTRSPTRRRAVQIRGLTSTSAAHGESRASGSVSGGRESAAGLGRCCEQRRELAAAKEWGAGQGPPRWSICPAVEEARMNSVTTIPVQTGTFIPLSPRTFRLRHPAGKRRYCQWLGPCALHWRTGTARLLLR